MPATIERQHYRRIQPPVHLDDETKRFLTQLQDSIHETTLPARSSPLAQFVILQGVTLISGTLATLRHGLGQPYTHYDCKRTYATYTDPVKGPGQTSQAFAVREPTATELQSVSAQQQDPTNYLVLVPLASGTYNVCIYGG